MAPVVASKASPNGRFPLIVYVNGGVPLIATTAELYATPTCPATAGHASGCPAVFVKEKLRSLYSNGPPKRSSKLTRLSFGCQSV